MPDLIYYTVGYNKKYISVLELSIRSLQRYSSADILVICDESFLSDCKAVLSERVLYMTVPDSKSKEAASMHKLNIFDYSNINAYDRVFFLDSDIIVHTPLDRFLDRVRRPGILYVYSERADQREHKNLCYSLLNYTLEDLLTFKLRKILVFNAGCFLFIRSREMKDHFDAVRTMIATHTGQFFYEQSFMNVYFNRLNATDRSVLVDANYRMGPLRGVDYKGFILHFSGQPGNADTKLEDMNAYYSERFLSS